MKIKSILAMSSDYTIGLKNSIPWKMSDDMKLFKEITTNHTLLVGSTTFIGLLENWPDDTEFFSNRDIVVLTRDKELLISLVLPIIQEKELNVDCVHILECEDFSNLPNEIPYNMNTLKIIKEMNLRGDLFICGGKKIYEQFFRFSSELHLTHIETNMKKDNSYLVSLSENFVTGMMAKTADIILTKDISKNDKNEYNGKYIHFSLI